MEIKLSHILENMAALFGMSFQVRGGDEEVIHVDDKPSFSNHISEGVVHELLKHGRGVAEAKEHDSGFKEPFVGDKDCLPLMTILDMDVVILPANFKSDEVASVL